MLRSCPAVAQHMHTAQQRESSDEWREFESLLAIVGAAYRTPEHEYAVIREAASNDLDGALMAYRDMADQIAGRPTSVLATLSTGDA